MMSVLAGLRALGPMKLGALALVAILSLGLVGMLAMRGGTAPMALLYADLELREAGQIVDQLDRARIPHETEAGGARILVPATDVARARLLLAKEGLPSGGSIGYEIFDRADGLTASAFQQSISQARAMEGELSRTIRMLQGVRAARVHLVLPRREPFARDRQDAQASVVLTMAGAARLDQQGVQAVLNLIAAAVPGLKPQNIAVVDSRGNLLARAGQPSSGLGAAQTGEELKHATETRIARAVEEMLERSLGPGRVRAEATVDLDFDQVRETQEKFDPDGQVIRSQQNSTGSNRTTEATPNVTVQNNLPNAEPSPNAAGTQEQKTDETTNYEISKTVRTVVREQPQLKRLSLAVMVDGIVATGPDGKPAWTARTDDELGRIGNLVRSAVGFDERRGDHVEIVSMRFAVPEDAPDAPALPVWARLGTADLVRLAEAGMLALAVVLCLAFVLRPMVLRLTLAGPQLAGVPGPADLLTRAGPADLLTKTGPADLLTKTGTPVLAGAGVAPAALASPDKPKTQPEDEATLQLDNIEGELKAGAIRRVTELVQKHPEATLATLRSWLTPDNER